ncbi:hypothetical protein C0993_009732 [Termitomyces sp. T159_Od127]|nr:hypothetical protein C0993_009732 [Termitomyces sp. T159_Od127]
MPALINYFVVDLVVSSPVFCYYQTRAGILSIWEQGRVIWDVALQQAGMEPREGHHYFVWSVVPRHELGDTLFSLAHVVPLAVLSRKDNKVPYLIDFLLCLPLVSVVSLSDFGCKEVILSFLHIFL